MSRVALESHRYQRLKQSGTSNRRRAGQAPYILDVEAFARYSYRTTLVCAISGSLVCICFDPFDGGRNAAIADIRPSWLRRRKPSPGERRNRASCANRLQQTGAHPPDDATRRGSGAAHGVAPCSSTTQGGSALRSRCHRGGTRELEAKTLFLQSQLEYIQANDEMTGATGKHRSKQLPN